MKKRIIGLVLVFMMMCSLVPCTVSAETSGTCGENLTWVLEDGTLTISGTGDMEDYYYGGAPWYGSRADITEVVISDGVTSIGDNAFRYCKNFTSISISDSITSVGDMTFYECTSLRSVSIPDSVAYIGTLAFFSCTGLRSVSIPDSVISVGEQAFNECGRLLISVDENNQYYSSSIGVLFNKDKTELVAYAKDKLVSEYTIPDSVTSIGSYAFCNCTSLTSVSIPNSVTSIGNDAFFSCTSLTSISIPDSVTSIGYYAFFHCTSLTSVSIPNSVTFIDYCAFFDCTSLISISIPDSISSLSDSVFCWCTSLTSISIPDSVTSIGSSAFSGCTSLTSISIPDSVTSIGSSAFSSCDSLTSVSIGDGVTSIDIRTFVGCGSLLISVNENNQYYSSEDGVLFNKDKTELVAYAKDKLVSEYTIPDSVTSIGSSAFSNCDSLTSIFIPDSVTFIGYEAFYWCDSLEEITLGRGITAIGYEAFYGCESLSDVYYLGTEGQWANIYIFDDNEPLTEATLHCLSVGGSYGDTVSWAYYDGTLTLDGYGDMPDNTAPWQDYISEITSIDIQGAITHIGSYAFAGCTGLESVKLTGWIESIGDSAFADCTALTDVYYAGTADKWSAVTIGSGNECLTSAALTTEAYRACEIKSVTVEDGKIYVDYSNNTGDEQTLIAVSRTADGAIISTDLADVGADDTTEVEMTPDGTQIIMIFIWNNMTPQCDAYAVNL